MEERLIRLENMNLTMFILDTLLLQLVLIFALVSAMKVLLGENRQWLRSKRVGLGRSFTKLFAVKTKGGTKYARQYKQPVLLDNDDDDDDDEEDEEGDAGTGDRVRLTGSVKRKR